MIVSFPLLGLIYLCYILKFQVRIFLWGLPQPAFKAIVISINWISEVIYINPFVIIKPK